MVHLKKSKSNSLFNHTESTLLTHIRPNSHVVIALSGGVDSVVLLHLLAILSKHLNFSLSAIHVDHGISSNAAHWRQFCHNLCLSFDLPIITKSLNLKKTPGVSLEALARDERYQIFNQLQADYIALAQHLDDQAETLLLQLFRGAGIRGLSAMPIIRKQSSDMAPQVLRPLLQVSRREIEQYAEQNQLSWIHDESNDSTDFNRNFLRHKVLPLLKEKYPNYAKTLLRTSKHLSEASLLLDELAEIDRQQYLVSGKLQMKAMHELSIARAKNLLRFTLVQSGIRPPSTAKLDDILQQLRSTRLDTQINITIDQIILRCYQGLIFFLPKLKTAEPTWRLTWHGENPLQLANLHGTIRFTHIKSQGIDQIKLSQYPVTIRLRQGGERFAPHCNRPRRSLKKLLQEAAIPPWKRYTMPLLFSGERLVWVPDIGIDYEFQVKSEQVGLVPNWQSETIHSL